MNVVVGLGNPGRIYERTPHNAGFRVIEALADRNGETLRMSARLQARVVKTDLGGRRTVLAQPRTFMNLSGVSVSAILRCNGAPPSDMIVVLDDADLDAGVLRIRPKGGSGGHKGLQSIIQAVGTDAFCRVRVGVGRDPAARDLAGHVLRPLTGEARAAFEKTVDRAAEAVVLALEKGVETAMNRYNGSTNE